VFLEHRLDTEFVIEWTKQTILWASTFNSTSLIWATSVLLRIVSPNFRFIEEKRRLNHRYVIAAIAIGRRLLRALNRAF